MLSIVAGVTISYCLKWCWFQRPTLMIMRLDNQFIHSIPSGPGMNGDTDAHVPA